MAEIQLLLDTASNRRVLSNIVGTHYQTVTAQTVGQSDLYIVDDVSLPAYHDDLIERKHDESPVFCPVVLIRRERTPITIDLPDPNAVDPPLLVNESLHAPVEPPDLFRTITNLLSRRERTADLTADLREKNERLERYARALAHELRNPVQLVDSYLIRARETGAEEDFERCASAVSRITSVIDDTMVVLQEGERALDTGAVDLSRCCTAARDVRGTPEPTVQVETDRRIVADEVKLTQLLENLFRNAVEHNSPETTIRVGDLPDEDGFFVEDDGEGIPEALQETVFEEGFTSGGAGMGMGLSVVQSVADAHGWAISLTDASDGGARFEIAGVDVVDT